MNHTFGKPLPGRDPKASDMRSVEDVVDGFEYQRNCDPEGFKSTRAEIELCIKEGKSWNDISPTVLNEAFGIMDSQAEPGTY